MKEKPSFSKGQEFKHAKWEYGSHLQIFFSEFSLFLRFIQSSCEFNCVATEIKAKVIVAHSVMYYAKCILNCFGCLEARILVGNLNI